MEFSYQYFEQNPISNYFSFTQIAKMFHIKDTVETSLISQCFVMLCGCGHRCEVNCGGLRYLFHCKVIKKFWEKLYLTILVPITPSHLDVNRLIREARRSGLHLFPIYSCQTRARVHSRHCFSSSINVSQRRADFILNCSSSSRNTPNLVLYYQMMICRVKCIQIYNH